MRKMLFGLLLATAGPALAEMEPGEWAFTSTTTIGVTKPTSTTFQNCVRKEDTGNPQRWLQRNQQTDCRFSNIRYNRDAYHWDVTCPAAGWRGTGAATAAKGRMSSETRVGDKAKGGNFQMVTKVTGRRVGPCR